MTRPLILLAAGLLAAAGASAADPDKFHPVPLADHVNVKLDENLHSDRYPNNNLKSLPAGKQKFGGVPFEVGKGVVQLGSGAVPGKPTEVEGIKVGKPAAKLHFLHATGFSAEADVVVAKYVVRYQDKTSAEVEVAYGRDVVDWWSYPDQTPPTDGKVAWEGENEASKGFEAKIKLYLTTWTNPHPDKVVTAIDFLAADPDQQAAPFCVAITAEGK